MSLTGLSPACPLDVWDRAVSAELLPVLCRSLAVSPGGASDAMSVTKSSSAASPELPVRWGDAAANRLSGSGCHQGDAVSSQGLVFSFWA